MHFNFAIPKIILSALQGKHIKQWTNKKHSQQKRIYKPSNNAECEWQNIHTSSSNLTSLPLHIHSINCELEFLCGRIIRMKQPEAKDNCFCRYGIGQDLLVPNSVYLIKKRSSRISFYNRILFYSEIQLQLCWAYIQWNNAFYLCHC